MNIIDLHDPLRVDRIPDAVEVLLSSGNFIQDNFIISKVELRLYTERTDEKLGVFSLITLSNMESRPASKPRITTPCARWSKGGSHNFNLPFDQTGKR